MADDIVAEDSDSSKPDKMFSLKKWNSVAMWSKFLFNRISEIHAKIILNFCKGWDVECEIW